MATFGISSILQNGDSRSRWVCVSAVAAFSGVLQSISWYCYSSTGTTQGFALYDSDGSGGGPGTLLAVTVTGTMTNNVWNTLAISGTKPHLVAGHNYYLAFGANDVSHTAVTDTTTGSNSYCLMATNVTTYPTPAGSPFSTTTPKNCSIYGTYTTSVNSAMFSFF